LDCAGVLLINGLVALFFPMIQAGSLLKEPPPPGFVNAVRASTPESFAAMDA
jgi:hypothetical protein